jgi:cell division topological specificity factor
MKFYNLFRRSKTSEKEIAEQRLRLILAHDRANISPGLLEILKDEIIAVISKHLDVDATKVDVSFTRDQRETRLVADIPLGRARESRP